MLASICGYLVGQLLNAYVLVKIKERTKERKLWLRLIGSTVVGEFADAHAPLALAPCFPGRHQLGARGLLIEARMFRVH